MSFNGDDIGRALDACYDAVVSPDEWPRALHALSMSVGASAAMFFPKDVNENAAQMPASPDYVEFLEHYVRHGWYDGHYRSERGWPLLEKNPTAVILEHDLATDEERKRLPHYNDLYLRWGYKGFAAIGFQVDGEPWCVPLLRSLRQGFFERHEAGTLAQLSHHFSRMARLNRRFAVTRNATGLEALDRIDRAALLLDHNGRVIEMNGRAEDLLSRSRGVLAVRNGRLCALHPDSDRRLQALAAASTSASFMRVARRQAAPVVVRRPAGRPLVVEAVTLPRLITPLSSKANALVIVTDLDAPLRTSGALLARMFGLTPAEVRLCEALMHGLSVKDAAERLGITEQTTRHRLKIVFHKTDTNRQSELMLLLAKL